MTENQGNPEKSDAAKREEEILAFWRENKTFERSLEKKSPKGEFVFYDGPPFATGLPHHGSLLSSIIKDVIPRYKTMRGYHVRRRWGWDTHGLPIESLVEKELGLKTKKEIEEIGIAKFNDAARGMVLKYVQDWKQYVERVGRWVDYENSYKTMDNSYIESVWWGLKQIHEKGLLYEGKKVLMYCSHCETPLAKAEIAMDNTYKDVTEEAITVKFALKDQPKTFFLAWTTTPWTLPGNVALAVGADIEYVKASVGDTTYILAKERVASVLKDVTHVIVGTVRGNDLVGKAYTPVFDVAPLSGEKSFRVHAADFVTTEDGTGIVHIAPMYGEDDYQLGAREGLPMVQLLNPNGTYNDSAPAPLRNLFWKEANKDIKKDLEARETLFARMNHTHSYPHCWRCGTPLIYNAVSSWFINIQKVKDRLISENQNINWVPEHLKNGRFGKIVEGAPDWTISRNRFWASPLPFWKSKDGKVMVVGSLDELKARVKKSGNRYFVMRHGEAEQNVKGILSSNPNDGVKLTAVGRGQVEKSAETLKKQNISKIYTSPFERAKETALIAAKALGLGEESVVEDVRLGELNFGDLSGESFEDFLAYRSANMRSYTDCLPSGESYLEAKKRFGECVYELERRHHKENILIVSHGIAFESLLAIEKGADSSESMRIVEKYAQEYAQVYEFLITPLPLNHNYELDLHRPYTDDLVLLDEAGEEYRRIPEVIDCWVESGSMPFAEYHYPFEGKAEFEKRAPGDFIAEYIAQTRTWFYYMHALGVVLFDRIAFKNVVTTGTIVAADGEKISKSKKNYTDPLELIDRYGADALRLYLMGSPVMQAEDLRFRDEDVRDAHNRVIGILWNSFKFFDLYQKEYDGSAEARKSEHVLDRWVLALLDETNEEITAAFEVYDTPRACRAIKSFVDEYSTWYVRRSRERVKSEWHDRQFALATQREVLLTFSKLIAPVLPFLAESIYRPIADGGSVHLEGWPETPLRGFFARLFAKKDIILSDMRTVRGVVTKALEARDKAKIKVRQPLRRLSIGVALPEALSQIIAEEVNVKEVITEPTLGTEVHLDTEITPELAREGLVREIIRMGQDERKKAGCAPNDRLARVLVAGSEDIVLAVNEYMAEIQDALRADALVVQPSSQGTSVSLNK